MTTPDAVASVTTLANITLSTSVIGGALMRKP